MFLFVARGLEAVEIAGALADDEEELEVVRLSLEHALEAVELDAKSWITLVRLRDGLAHPATS